MSASLGEAVLYLLGDDTKLKATTSQAQKDTQASLNKMGKGMQTSGALMTAGLTAPLIAAGVVAVNAASDLGESINAVNVIFGDGAKNITDYGETAAKTVGLSNQQFNSLATTTGAFLQNVGFNAEQAGDKTIQLTERSADLASVFNTDVSSALGAIQSGLKGEFNPLEQFGVKLNAAAIEAKALSMGLGSTTVDMVKVEGATLKVEKTTKTAADMLRRYGADHIKTREAVVAQEKAQQALEKALEGGTTELTDSAKAAAALELIFQQTEKVSGDFANTSEGLANSQRIAKAEMADAAAKMGQNLLPIALQLTAAISSLAAWFTALSPEGQKTVLVVLAIAAALGPLLMIVGTLITSIAAIMPVLGVVTAALTGPVLLAIAAIIAIVALLYLAWTNNFGGIQQKTATVIAAIKGFILGGLTLIRAWWDEHGAAILAAANAAWEGIKAVINVILAIIKQVFSAFRSAFEGDWYAFGQKLRVAWDMAWKAIVTAVEAAWKLLKAAVALMITNVIKFFKETNWGQVGTNIVQGIANGITAGLQWVRNAALAAAQAAWNAVRGFFDNQSPSKLMMKEGLNFDAGLAQGIDNNAGMVVKAAVNMSQAAAAAASHQVSNYYSLTGQYSYQSETTLMDEVRLLQLMEASR